MMKQYLKILLFLTGICTATPVFAYNFKLIDGKNALPVYINSLEDSVVYTAFNLLSDDLLQVAGVKPIRMDKIKDGSVIIGTIGKSPYLNELAKSGLINLKGIENKWEGFILQTIWDEKNGRSLLVVAGSDSRGTAFGILEISRLLGVSPWHWWADVIPEKKEKLILDPIKLEECPDVQYRGIFLNDEDWGLMPWSSKTFASPGTKGEIGALAYEKIFELLLRLRANTLWPAMHEKTVPFYFVEGNREMAERYGIVMGTSHCEPLMRNSAAEWDRTKYGDYNWLTNEKTVTEYWTERLEELKHSENFFTIGMRGVHDGKMEGVKTLDEQTNVLGDVIQKQRSLLSQYINPDSTAIPQSFVPYKEVLEIYNNGLKVPDDVTLVWCDDNYGYITQLSNPEERKRKGGAGIYYHCSYWGRPHDYLWLSTTQAGLIGSEMERAWRYGAKKLWILNVGDIKPAEYNISFFLDMAWDVEGTFRKLPSHQKKWLSEIFPAEDNVNIPTVLDSIMTEYYRLASIRKPEFMGWSRVEEYSKIKGGKTPTTDTEFQPYAFGDEIQKRIEAYGKLKQLVETLRPLIPRHRQAAYFELIEYPVLASDAMNRKFLYAQKSRLYSKYGLSVADEYADLSRAAYNEIAALTHKYNRDLLDGKWNEMMDMKPRNLAVFQMPALPEKRIGNPDQTLLWVDGDTLPLKEGEKIILPDFVLNQALTSGLSIFSHNHCIEWNINNIPAWLSVTEKNTGLKGEKRITFHLKNTGSPVQGKTELSFIVNGKIYPLEINVKNLPADYQLFETEKVVAFNAAKTQLPAGFKIIKNLGHSNEAVAFPAPQKRVKTTLEYKIYTFSEGEAELTVAVIPNHPVNGKDIRYSIQIDNQQEKIISTATKFRSEPWKINVLRNQNRSHIKVRIDKPGAHTIRITALASELIIDQIMLDFKPERKYYEIPVRNHR